MKAPVGRSSGRRLDNVQHLRAVAALTVLASHLVEVSWKQAGWGRAAFNLDGRFGVDVFFVISGFIMVYTSASAFGAKGAVPEFAWRRLVRILPLYWLCTAVEAALVWHSRLDDAGGGLTAVQVLKSLFFIPFFNEAGKMRPVLGVGWSLDFEMLFYAVFALGMALPLRRGLVLVGAVFAGLIALGLAWGQSAGAPDVLRAWTSPILLEFLIGVGLGAAFLRLPRGWTAPAVPALPLALGLVLFEAAYLAFLAPGKGEDLGWRPAFWLIAALVVGSALFTRQSDGRGLLARTMLLLGDASYAIYLTHPIVLGLLVKAMSLAHVRGAAWLALLPVGGLAAVLAGAAVHLWVERPVTRRLRWRGRDHGAGLAPANP